MARTIAVGIGIMEYPFDTTGGFWRWVDLCEAGGIDSIWQTDRMVSRSPVDVINVVEFTAPTQLRLGSLGIAPPSTPTVSPILTVSFFQPPLRRA